MGPGRRYYDVVVVKGTYRLAPGRLELAPEQAPPALVDSYFDEANVTRSSVSVAGDLIVTKPSTDVLVTGSAASPGGTPRREWITSVQVKDGDETLFGHTARVTGPAVFQHSAIRGWGVGPPAAATSVPIRYEQSYGGSHPDPDQARREEEAARWMIWRDNPSGSGHWDPRVLDRSRTYPAPQWTSPGSPTELLGRHPLVGFGPLARWWRDRHQYAGTYDEAWKTRARQEAAEGIFPDYPADFDVRFFQSAHPELIAPTRLRGDESVVLNGFVAEAPQLEFCLPSVRVRADLFRSNLQMSSHALPLDTVHVDLDAKTVSLAWRLTVLQGFEVETAVLLAEELS